MVEVESTVIKMVIAKVDRDQREEATAPLTSKITLDVGSSPRQLARIANMMSQGADVVCVLRARNAKTDLKVEVVDVPHQMGLGEAPPVNTSEAETSEVKANLCDICEVKPSCQYPVKSSGNVHACEGFKAPSSESKQAAEPGSSQEAEPPKRRTRKKKEAVTQQDDNHNNNHGSHDPVLENTIPLADLSTFDFRPANGTAVPTKFYLHGLSEEAEDGDDRQALVRLFKKCNIDLGNPEGLIEHVKAYPPSDQKSLVLEFLRG